MATTTAYKLKRVCDIKTKIEKLLQKNTPSPNDSTSIDPTSSDSSHLEHGSTQNDELVLLKTLNGLQLDLDILTSSKIGITVNAMRKKSSDPVVQQLAKSLIRKWKKILDQETQKQVPNLQVPTGSHSESETQQKSKEMSQSKKRKKANQESGIPNKIPEQGYTKKKKSEEEAPAPSTIIDEEIAEFRMKSRKLLLEALKCDEDEISESGQSPEVLVEQLEEFIFKELKDTGFKYKSRIRSRLSNLRDSRNPDLKLMFLTGKISPQTLAKMTSEEMASEEMKVLRAKLAKEAIDNAQLAINPGTKSGMIKCGKCRKSNCTYNQLQTRSADEPMTTFVLCNNCGHRFKFN